MDLLKNKTILIGKEPGQGRLLISMKINGQPKTAAIGAAGSVPGSVSRCNPAQNVAHCQIEVGPDGRMVLTNLKPQNVTYVNGVEIASKKIAKDNQVLLGMEQYPVNISTVLDTAKKLVGTVPQPPKSIAHLEKVWNEYETTLENIQRAQLDRNRKRMLPIMIGTGAGVISMLASQEILIALPLAILPLLLYIKNYTEKDTSIDDRKAANDKFIDHYVCPHSHCRHYLGNQPYKVLRQNKNCPYCKGEWKAD